VGVGGGGVNISHKTDPLIGLNSGRFLSDRKDSPVCVYSETSQVCIYTVFRPPNPAASKHVYLKIKINTSGWYNTRHEYYQLRIMYKDIKTRHSMQKAYFCLLCHIVAKRKENVRLLVDVFLTVVVYNWTYVGTIQCSLKSK